MNFLVRVGRRQLTDQLLDTVTNCIARFRVIGTRGWDIIPLDALQVFSPFFHLWTEPNDETGRFEIPRAK